MTYSDFCKHFSRVYICTLGPDFNLDGIIDSNYMFNFHGSWIPGISAGGCSDNIDLYSINPQYIIHIKTGNTLPNIINGDLLTQTNKHSYLMVSLIQKFERSWKKSYLKNTEQYVNFRLYPLSQDRESRFSSDFFVNAKWISPFTGEVNYINNREVTSRFLLKDGYYVVVPSMFDAHSHMSFLLRLYT